MKRMVSLLLCMVLLISAVSGCGAAKESTASAPQSASSSQQETKAPVEMAPESDAAPVSAEESTAAAETAAEPEEIPPTVFPLTDETITLRYFTLPPANFKEVFSTWADLPSLKQMEEKSHVHIEWIEPSFEAFSTQFNLLVASGDMPDLFNTGTNAYAGGRKKAVEDGVFMDLTELIYEYAPNYAKLLEDPDVFRYIADDDGSISSFQEIYDEQTPTFGNLIRKDWLDALGLEIPKTYDDYTNVLKAFKQAYSPSAPYLMPKVCQSGTTLAAGFGTPGYWASEEKSGSHFYVEDGVIHSALIEDGYRQYLELMHQWYEDGLISVDFITVSDSFIDSTRTGLITSGETGIFYSGVSFSSMYQDAATDPNFELVGVPDAVPQVGDQVHFLLNNRVNYDACLTIAATCEYPEVAVQWLDYWYSDEGSNIYNFGIEGESWTPGPDGTPELTALVTENEWGVPANKAISAFSMNTNLTGKCQQKRLSMFFEDYQIETIDNWMSNADSERLIPVLSMDEEHNQLFSQYLADIETYAMECISQFIIGDMPMSQWDQFVETLKDMHMDECISIYQEAYEKWRDKEPAI